MGAEMCIRDRSLFSSKVYYQVTLARNKSEWDNIVEQFDVKSLAYVFIFLSENKITDKVEALADDCFKSAYNSLSSLGFDKKSALYRFFKIIQGRHA